MQPIVSLTLFEVGQLYVAIGYSGMKSLHPDLQEKIRKAYQDASNAEQEIVKLTTPEMANLATE